MEVCVKAPMFGFANWVFPPHSVVREVLDRFVQTQGSSSSSDFYVVRNGRLSDPDEPLQPGAAYRLEPRLCGGKGGFGSMLRALGAQIEKTTNREACRDLSGRRLRDVNHEKEMAEWLRKQAEREAEREQQRAERLQRKLREPEHRFSDTTFQQQSHQLAERLEDSVIKGLQASSSGQVRADHAPTSKRHRLEQIKEPHTKRRKMATCWTGLEELQSSEDDDEDGNKDSVSALSPSSAEVLVPEDVEPEQISRAQECRPSDQEEGPGPSRAQQNLPSDQEERPGPSRAQQNRPSDQEERPGPSRAQQNQPSDQEERPGPSRAQESRPSDQEEGPGPSRAQESQPSDQEEGPGPSRAQQNQPSDQEEGPGPSRAQESQPSDQEEGPGPSRAQESQPSDQEEGPGPSRAQQNQPSDQEEGPGPSRAQQNQPSGDCEAPEQVQPVVDLTTVTSVEQLEVLGLDVLKKELRRRGLKCGGTLAERAGRLFSIRGLPADQVDPALLARPTKTRRKR